MKSKIRVYITCMITLIMLATAQAIAQQPANAKPENFSPQMQGANASAGYTYKIFQAPNKMYGFDILKNGKFIFHQPASNMPANTYHPALAKKEDAEKAALFSIEKITKGKQPSMLSNDEIKKIITQKPSDSITVNH